MNLNSAEGGGGGFGKSHPASRLKSKNKDNLLRMPPAAIFRI
jgi:hypothetical protein